MLTVKQFHDMQDAARSYTRRMLSLEYWNVYEEYMTAQLNIHIADLVTKAYDAGQRSGRQDAAQKTMQDAEAISKEYVAHLAKTSIPFRKELADLLIEWPEKLKKLQEGYWK